MNPPSLSDLPPPPPERTGWPWTKACDPWPPSRSDGSCWPRVTIVTPSYNQGQYIEETIRSILLQGYPDLEYFVIDGGSTDQTFEIIKKYEKWIDFWQSAPDKGQPDAINKGIERASGAWFQNINSDDVLCENALSIIFAANVECDVVCGHVLEFSEDGSTWLVHNRGLKDRNLIKQRSRTHRMGWHQPGVFLRTTFLRELGGYDTKFQYLFDLHLTIRYIERFKRVFYLDSPVVHFRIHPDAKSSAWGARYRTEEVAVRKALSLELCSAENRKLAEVEALRRRAMQLVKEALVSDQREQFLGQLVEILHDRPVLLINRMIVGSIWRMPSDWWRAVKQFGGPRQKKL